MFLALLALMVSMSARAAAIDEYSATVDLRKPGVERFTLSLKYWGSHDPVQEGFKFLGEGDISKLHLVDSPGARIREVPGYASARVEYTLAKDSANNPLPITFTFERRRWERHHWDGRRLDYPWITRFGIPVDDTRIALLVPTSWSPRNYDCEIEQHHKRCHPMSGWPDPTSNIRIHTANTLALNVLAATFACACFVGGFFGIRRLARRWWTRERGVVPVVEHPAPDLLGGYRAPAPLPVDTELEPVLLEEDGSLCDAGVRAAVGVSAVGLIAFVLTGDGISTVPMWLVLLVYPLVLLPPAGYAALREERKPWLPLFLSIGLAIAIVVIGDRALVHDAVAVVVESVWIR